MSKPSTEAKVILTDEVFKIPKPPTAKFINECEYRVLTNPDNPSESGGICKMISMAANARHGVTPIQCATCRATGEIDQTYVRVHIVKLLQSKLRTIQLGFYDTDQDGMEDLFRKSMKFAHDDPQWKKFLVHQFGGAMRGHMNMEYIKRLRPLIEELLKSKDPEPLDLGKGAKPGMTGTGLPASVKVDPAENKIDTVGQTNFGCCGGKNLFRMLAHNPLSLIGPDEVEFNIKIGMIASISDLSGEHNLPGMNSIFRLHNGTVLVARETTGEIGERLQNMANAATDPDEPTSLTAKFINAGKSFLDVAKMLTGKASTEEEYQRRKAVCEACQKKDAEGEPLFRKSGEIKKHTIYSCGKPFYKTPLRIAKRDGCGCILNVKWGGAEQVCPFEKW